VEAIIAGVEPLIPILVSVNASAGDQVKARGYATAVLAVANDVLTGPLTPDLLAKASHDFVGIVVPVMDDPQAEAVVVATDGAIAAFVKAYQQAGPATARLATARLATGPKLSQADYNRVASLRTRIHVAEKKIAVD
jgi:hypothetical protein